MEDGTEGKSLWLLSEEFRLDEERAHLNQYRKKTLVPALLGRTPCKKKAPRNTLLPWAQGGLPRTASQAGGLSFSLPGYPCAPQFLECGTCIVWVPEPFGFILRGSQGIEAVYTSGKSTTPVVTRSAQTRCPVVHPVFASTARKLKLEWYRKDQLSLCTRMTRRCHVVHPGLATSSLTQWSFSGISVLACWPFFPAAPAFCSGRPVSLPRPPELWSSFLTWGLFSKQHGASRCSPPHSPHTLTEVSVTPGRISRPHAFWTLLSPESCPCSSFVLPPPSTVLHTLLLEACPAAAFADTSTSGPRLSPRSHLVHLSGAPVLDV